MSANTDRTSFLRHSPPPLAILGLTTLSGTDA
jgi:hypothetical protein